MPSLYSRFAAPLHCKALTQRSTLHAFHATPKPVGLALPRCTPGAALSVSAAPASTDAPAAPSTMPETDLEQAAQRVRQLEQEALDMHDLAQRLNKEGRFEEAQAAYAAMHRLEDEASELAARVGCVACVLGEPQEGQEQPSLCTLDPDSLLPYQQLHRLPPLQPSTGVQPSEGGRQSPTPSLERLGARAAGCVVGSLLADAAAMGVHWVYDLAVLDELEAERRGQASATATTTTTTPPSSSSHSSLGPPTSQPYTVPEHPYGFGLEFQEPPRSTFYAYSSGRNSPYGEQTLVVLRSLAEQGGLHCERYAELFAAEFGTDSGFEGYRDVSTKGFLRNFGRGMPPPLSGANDAQANCIARLAPVVVAFGAPAPAPAPGQSGPQPQPPAPAAATSAAGAAEGAAAPEPSGSGGGAVQPFGLSARGVLDDAVGGRGERKNDPLLRCVELATRVTQNTDAAVAWASVGAMVLEGILLGSTAEAAVQAAVQDLRSPSGRLAPYCEGLVPELAAHLERVLELRTTPVPEAVAALGRNCHMPNALQTPLQIVLFVEQLVRGRQRARTAQPAEGAAATGSEPSAEWGSEVVCAEAGEEGGLSLPPEVYVWGVRLAVREGGCCASRAAYVGACLGAMVATRDGGGLRAGLAVLPEAWLAKYPAGGRVRAWAEAIVRARLAVDGGVAAR